MAINFPDSPNVNDEFTSGDSTWIYDGTKWLIKAVNTPDNYIICTSSTRPGSPYTGLQIFETDTKLLYMYNGAQWVLVDNLTLDHTPSFWVYRTSNQSGTGTVVFPVARQNVGSHYNTSTGLFTVPVNGTYHFSYQFILNNSGTGAGGYKFIINGAAYSGPTTYNGIGGGWTSVSASINVPLQSTNTVGVYAYEPGFIYTYGDGSNVHNTFTGALISYR